MPLKFEAIPLKRTRSNGLKSIQKLPSLGVMYACEHNSCLRHHSKRPNLISIATILIRCLNMHFLQQLCYQGSGSQGKNMHFLKPNPAAGILEIYYFLQTDAYAGEQIVESLHLLGSGHPGCSIYWKDNQTLNRHFR